MFGFFVQLICCPQLPMNQLEKKTKHYLTSGFLTPLARTQGKVRNNTFPLRRSDNFVHKCLLGIAPQYHAYFLVMLIFK